MSDLPKPDPASPASGASDATDDKPHAAAGAPAAAEPAPQSPSAAAVPRAKTERAAIERREDSVVDGIPAYVPSGGSAPIQAPEASRPAAGPAKPSMVDDASDGVPLPPPGNGEHDPMAVATAAIAKLRQRARTDLAELRVQYHQHDIFVLLFAVGIMIAAGRLHRRMVTPPVKQFSERGLSFNRSTAWLNPEPVAPVAARLLRTWEPPAKPATAYHVAFTAMADAAHFEVFIDDAPPWSNVVTGLEIDRRTRWGELYALTGSKVIAIKGHDWLRTEYTYAHATEHGDAPTVDSAVEYATVDRERIYVVSFFGSSNAIAAMESVTAPTLQVESQTGLPLVPQVGRATKPNQPGAVGKAFDSTVMVIVADLVDGRLQPKGGGSGVVIATDGSILTNHHVVHDSNQRLHDVFIIARSNQTEKAPVLICAGRPSRSKLQPEIDLALIKCDMDLDGRQWDARAANWQPLSIAKPKVLSPGMRLWVVGYPDVGGGGLTVDQGVIEGFTDQYIKTDAPISHGNSGGPVVTDDGTFVGIATVFRTRVTVTGDVVETSKVGLIRPLVSAGDLTQIAAAGWTPREGKTGVDLEPTAIEAPAEGVRLGTKITDFANGAPIKDALIMVLRRGVNASKIDINRLDDQVLSWGRSNSMGEVHLKQPVPVPGTYSVVVFAKGYQTLIGDNELRLEESSPMDFDPWGGVTLEAR
ncbi:MAG: trypsin-like peptidase domain-containing protein [Kofleriaceae bacterium]|nr:trypsin-like peptidase domain-containing protein [Kofleriaceae bacterium]